MFGITSTQQSRVVVVQLGARGRIVRSWPVPLPTSKLQRVSADLTIGEEGNAAVAIEYEDDQYVPTGASYPHEAPECCGHIAISSWRLGQAPPVAHDVSPKVRVDSRQPYWPQIVLAKSEVTAVWRRGNETPNGIGEAEDQLEQAYGKVGQRLHTRSVLHVPGQIDFLDLHLEPDGRPVASWIDDGSILRTDIGSVREGLGVSRRFQALFGNQEGVGFTHDARGHTVFASVLGKHLMIIASSDGGKFGDAHRIATLPSNATAPEVRAGGDAVLLVSWVAQYVVGRDEGSSDRFDVELGHIFGATSPPFQLPVATNSEADEGQARSFVDSQGRAVLIASRYKHGLAHYEPVVSSPKMTSILGRRSRSRQIFSIVHFNWNARRPNKKSNPTDAEKPSSRRCVRKTAGASTKRISFASNPEHRSTAGTIHARSGRPVGGDFCFLLNAA